ncbi:MAG: Holliday junction resolvase RuvX [Gammaproteobacteria bacterium]|nr:Holliday junction resolvase RuvX [Gammaproteobacteria bacterium]
MKNPPEILLGFDFGMKRIGVAVGQTVTKTARPLGVVKATLGIPQWDTLKKFIHDWRPDALVVGVPLNMDGTEQPLTQAARQFSNALAERFQLPVFGIDERLTSVEAKDRIFSEGGYKALKNSQIDSIAAQLILQNWLTQTNHT